MTNDFIVFILSHGRADNVKTVQTLKNAGYTGVFVILIDNEDKNSNEYYNRYGNSVWMFDKKRIAETTDVGDNFPERNVVVFARNAAFEIAEQLGFKYFMVLDDDYSSFQYMMDGKYNALFGKDIKNLDAVLELFFEYYKSIPAVSIAMAQGGDFIGGLENRVDESINQRRKCMNTFLLSTERRFDFIGRINEDVTAYTKWGSTGLLFITYPLLRINQTTTQKVKGGLTESYLDLGTYVKSFYTVMYMPSSVVVEVMHSRHPRLHHKIEWDATVPCIIRESYQKTKKTL